MACCGIALPFTSLRLYYKERYKPCLLRKSHETHKIRCGQNVQFLGVAAGGSLLRIKGYFRIP
jgi:hypothetical protein